MKIRLRKLYTRINNFPIIIIFKGKNSIFISHNVKITIKGDKEV